jgi:hypothetical protein
MSAPVKGSSKEMRPEDIQWVDANLVSQNAPRLTEEHVLVLNLADPPPQAHAFLSALQKNPLRPTVIALGTPEQIENAKPEFADLDITYLDRPNSGDDNSALQDTYDELAAVYQPFTRSGIQFAPKDLALDDNSSSEQNPRTAQEALLAAIFGEHADDVGPIVAEIDPAYENPPFAFDQEQLQQMFTLVNRVQTEERRGDD